jgi:ferric-dicitrate binding protein FerR (iron transport regulator)
LPHGLSAEKIREATDRIEARLDRVLPGRKVVPLLRYAAAACLLVGMGVGGYFLPRKPDVAPVAVVMKHDVAPGGTEAILTLGNGEKIVLGKQRGQIAAEGETKILLNAKGNVNYQASAGAGDAAVTYNTLTVPIGNHRDMTLADGTEVSLDAGSSITFPVIFSAKERVVSITGQAYFKVKHDADHPFSVKVKGLLIRDIGTEFNINAYDDEGPVKTTLVEGSVKVNETLLAPGQQAVADDTNHIRVKTADIDVVTAWRSNNFLFRNQNLETTMRQIARWYNVKISYEQAPKDLRILADISRDHNLSVVLHAIERTGKVKFKIEGRTVTVSQ